MTLHWFAYVMIVTFIGALGTMMAGLVNLSGDRSDGKGSGATRSNTLMFARVGLCFLLVAEILIYVTYFKS